MLLLLLVILSSKLYFTEFITKNKLIIEIIIHTDVYIYLSLPFLYRKNLIAHNIIVTHIPICNNRYELNIGILFMKWYVVKNVRIIITLVDIAAKVHIIVKISLTLNLSILFYSFIISSNSSSFKTFTPSSIALSNFDPASSPAITKSVFLLTLPETFAPNNSNFAFISPLE